MSARSRDHLPGGTHVTIGGTGLATAEIVNIGGTFITDFKVECATAIEVTVPPGRNGTVNITVLTPVGWSAPNPHDRFTYAKQICTTTSYR